MAYGKELILDLHNCDITKFNRKDLKKFFIEVCDLVDMERCKLCWWDDVGVAEEEKQTLPHLKGTSAVQFISTSNIVIHTLDLLGAVYINLFSCKEFDDVVAREYMRNYFNGTIVNTVTVNRI